MGKFAVLGIKAALASVLVAILANGACLNSWKRRRTGLMKANALRFAQKECLIMLKSESQSTRSERVYVNFG
jgi:hypothetical protein